MAKSKRNGKIEFLRFIFSIIIVVHHSRNILGDDKSPFLGGSFAVEFFFLVSGYLMMASIEKISARKADTHELGKETLSFLWKKAKSVYPELFIGWVIAILFTAYAKQKSLLGMAGLVVDSFFELTLLKMSGLYSISLNGVTWYISSMLLCMAILYPLLRKYPDMMKHIVLPMIVLLTLGYLGGEYIAPRDPLKWIGFTKKGNIRAMGEIALGALCYQAVKATAKIELTRLGKLLVTVVEWCAYVLLILFMYFMKASGRDYFFLAVMALAVGLSFSHKGIDADFFDKPICIWLGKWSLPLYLGHTFYAYYLNIVVPEYLSDSQKMAIYLALSITTSFVIWGLSLAVKRVMPKVVHAAKNLLIEKASV